MATSSSGSIGRPIVRKTSVSKGSRLPSSSSSSSSRRMSRSDTFSSLGSTFSLDTQCLHGWGTSSKDFKVKQCKKDCSTMIEEALDGFELTDAGVEKLKNLKYLDQDTFLSKTVSSLPGVLSQPGGFKSILTAMKATLKDGEDQSKYPLRDIFLLLKFLIDGIDNLDKEGAVPLIKKINPKSKRRELCEKLLLVSLCLEAAEDYFEEFSNLKDYSIQRKGIYSLEGSTKYASNPRSLQGNGVLSSFFVDHIIKHKIDRVTKSWMWNFDAKKHQHTLEKIKKNVAKFGEASKVFTDKKIQFQRDQSLSVVTPLAVKTERVFSYFTREETQQAILALYDDLNTEITGIRELGQETLLSDLTYEKYRRHQDYLGIELKKCDPSLPQGKKIKKLKGLLEEFYYYSDKTRVVLLDPDNEKPSSILEIRVDGKTRTYTQRELNKDPFPLKSPLSSLNQLVQTMSITELTKTKFKEILCSSQGGDVLSEASKSFPYLTDEAIVDKYYEELFTQDISFSNISKPAEIKNPEVFEKKLISFLQSDTSLTRFQYIETSEGRKLYRRPTPVTSFFGFKDKYYYESKSSYYRQSEDPRWSRSFIPFLKNGADCLWSLVQFSEKFLQGGVGLLGTFIGNKFFGLGSVYKYNFTNRFFAKEFSDDSVQSRDQSLDNALDYISFSAIPYGFVWGLGNILGFFQRRSPQNNVVLKKPPLGSCRCCYHKSELDVHMPYKKVSLLPSLPPVLYGSSSDFEDSARLPDVSKHTFIFTTEFQQWLSRQDNTKIEAVISQINQASRIELPDFNWLYFSDTQLDIIKEGLADKSHSSIKTNLESVLELKKPSSGKDRSAFGSQLSKGIPILSNSSPSSLSTRVDALTLDALTFLGLNDESSAKLVKSYIKTAIFEHPYSIVCGDNYLFLDFMLDLLSKQFTDFDPDKHLEQWEKFLIIEKTIESLFNHLTQQHTKTPPSDLEQTRITDLVTAERIKFTTEEFPWSSFESYKKQKYERISSKAFGFTRSDPTISFDYFNTHFMNQVPLSMDPLLESKLLTYFKIASIRNHTRAFTDLGKVLDEMLKKMRDEGLNMDNVGFVNMVLAFREDLNKALTADGFPELDEKIPFLEAIEKAIFLKPSTKPSMA